LYFHRFLVWIKTKSFKLLLLKAKPNNKQPIQINFERNVDLLSFSGLKSKHHILHLSIQKESRSQVLLKKVYLCL